MSHFVTGPAHCPLPGSSFFPVTTSYLEDSALALPPQEAPLVGSHRAQALVLIRGLSTRCLLQLGFHL